MPSVDDMELEDEGENDIHVEIMLLAQRIELLPIEIVQSPFALKNILGSENARNFRSLLEIRGFQVYHVPVRFPAECLVEVSYLRVAHIQVKNVIFFEKCIFAMNGLLIEFRRESIIIEALHHEIDQGKVLLGAPLADFLNYSVSTDIAELPVLGDGGQGRYYVIIISHTGVSWWLV